MTTYELARRLEGTSITANALHPGVVDTNFGAGTQKPPGSPPSISPEEGAATQIYLATSTEVEGVTGKYYDQCKPIESLPVTYDLEAAKKM